MFEPYINILAGQETEYTLTRARDMNLIFGKWNIFASKGIANVCIHTLMKTATPGVSRRELSCLLLENVEQHQTQVLMNTDCLLMSLTETFVVQARLPMERLISATHV